MSTPSPCAVEARPAGVVTAPLSWQQEQIWLHARAACPAPIYQETVAVTRAGGWQEAPLHAALESWAQRHGILRTTFPEAGGEAQQRIAAAPLPWDLHSVAAGSRAEARRAAAAEGAAPMDLERGPLWRLRWGRWPGGEELYLTLHHLIFDGYTLQQLWLPEWAAEYEARAAGAAPPVQGPALAYASYARWQRSAENREAAERRLEHRDFWRRHLAGEWPRLGLGGQPDAEPYAAASQPFAWDPGGFAAVAAMARAARVTPFMVLLAAFAVLLHRLSGQEAIIIGVPAAGRGQRQWERTPGPMVNTLALRFTIAGNPPFSAVVRQARDVVLEALGHQDFPFARALREAPGGVGAEAALEAYFSLQPPGEPPPAGWTVDHLAVDPGTAKFPLHWDLAWPGSGAVAGRCRYQQARVDSVLGAALPGHWLRLLAAAVGTPEMRIGALPLLSAEQRRRLLAMGQGPAPALPAGTVAEVFARQAAAAPERVALVALERPPREEAGAAAPLRRQEITYAQLRAAVERLAGGLRAAGVRPGETVGLALPRSPEAVLAMLAIVWCGAAYLPLNPADPPRRQCRFLALAGVRRIVGRGPEGTDAQSLRLEPWRPRGPADSGPGAGNPAAVDQTAAAYVMCTSGSTGEPQAVRIPQRGILRLVCGAEYARFGPDETYLLLAPLSFDAATFEVWAPLLTGGRLVVPPPGLPSGAELGEWIRQEGVTTLWLTAAWFNAVVETAPAALAPLRQVLTGGEVLSPRHLRRAQQALPGVALLNGYGPTENTTFTCVYPIPPLAAAEPSIPLGRPIPHSTAFVVDDYGTLAPQGAEGELWVGGAGLALEYVGGDAAGRFVRPLWNGGERLFRTGDRARWITAASGPVLSFLGRRDQQVKLRGMRLELAGIEAVLLRHPGVRQAAVAIEPVGGREELVAYAATQASVTMLGDWLARELPPAMIPARWVLRAELPRLASGKLDRQALRSLAAAGDGAAAGRGPGARGSPAPASETERRLARAWAQLLDRETVGRDEDFYALGGHSLLALRLLARIEREFGRRLPLAGLMACRTIAAQARWIEGAPAAAAAPEQPRAVRIQAGDEQARPRFFSIESAGYFLRLAEAMGPEQPWWGLRLASLRALPHPCPLEAVAAYHAATLRQVQPRGPYYLAGWCQNGVVAFELARQLLAAGEAVACLALLDAVSPAFLQCVVGMRWPVFRLRYAWRQRRQSAPAAEADAKTRRPEETAPSAALRAWRRRRYRWLPPRDPPRTGEPAALVQNALRSYRPAVFPGRILLFRSAGQVLADPRMGRYYDPSLGWEGWAARGLEVHTIRGGHISMFQPPGAAQIARVLTEVAAPDGAGAVPLGEAWR